MGGGGLHRRTAGPEPLHNLPSNSHTGLMHFAFSVGYVMLPVCVINELGNIRFVFASVPNSGPNSVFAFERIVSSEGIRIVSLYMYSAASDVYGRFYSVSARCSRSDRLIMGDD